MVVAVQEEWDALSLEEINGWIETIPERNRIPKKRKAWQQDFELYNLLITYLPILKQNLATCDAVVVKLL